MTPETPRRTLKDYRPQHDEDCPKAREIAKWGNKCPAEHSTGGWCYFCELPHGHIGAHSHHKGITWEGKTADCTCGLSALLAPERVETETPSDPLREIGRIAMLAASYGPGANVVEKDEALRAIYALCDPPIREGATRAGQGQEQKTHRGTSLTEGASVSVSVPAPQLSHAVRMSALQELLRAQEAYASTSPMKNRGVSAVRVQALRETIDLLESPPTRGGAEPRDEGDGVIV